MAEEKIFVSFGTSIDVVGGQLGSYDSQDSPGGISHDMFAGEIRTPKLLKLFQREGLPATWYWSGHSIETFPEQFDEVVAAGCEVGIYGHPHENPIAMTRRQKTEILDYCMDLIGKCSGTRPIGYVVPWQEFSPTTSELPVGRGSPHDHSLMHNDYTPYYVRVGNSWTNIDYGAESAHEWMEPLVRGEGTDLTELPTPWYLDDLPPMMLIKSSFTSHGSVSLRDIEQLQANQFDWVAWEIDYAVFPIAIHPDVSSHPQSQLMFERLIAHMCKAGGVEFTYMKGVTSDSKQRFPRRQRRYWSAGTSHVNQSPLSKVDCFGNVYGLLRQRLQGLGVGGNIFGALSHAQSCDQRLTLLMMSNRLSVTRVIHLRIWMDQAWAPDETTGSLDSTVSTSTEEHVRRPQAEVRRHRRRYQFCQMQLRATKPREIDEADTLIRTVFPATPAADGSEQDIVERLRSSTGHLPEQELIILDDRIVGHIPTTRVVIDNTAGPVSALEVTPLCVTSDHRCRGVDTPLMKETLNRGRTAEFPAVFLISDPRYYARFGFRPVAELGIHNASSTPGDVVLGIESKPGTLDNTDGSATLV